VEVLAPSGARKRVLGIVEQLTTSKMEELTHSISVKVAGKVGAPVTQDSFASLLEKKNCV
jgi:hypothetical protein